MAGSILSIHSRAWYCGVSGFTNVLADDTVRSSAKISRDRSNAVTPHLTKMSTSRSSRVGGSAGASVIDVGLAVGWAVVGDAVGGLEGGGLVGGGLLGGGLVGRFDGTEVGRGVTGVPVGGTMGGGVGVVGFSTGPAVGKGGTGVGVGVGPSPGGTGSGSDGFSAGPSVGEGGIGVGVWPGGIGFTDGTFVGIDMAIDRRSSSSKRSRSSSRGSTLSMTDAKSIFSDGVKGTNLSRLKFLCCCSVMIGL